MRSNIKNPKSSQRRTRRIATQIRHGSRACCGRRSFKNGGRKCSEVSNKLKALKNLIPANNNQEILKSDQLFQQTADYIVLLKTQVVVLQKLIELYGSSERENASLS